MCEVNPSARAVSDGLIIITSTYAENFRIMRGCEWMAMLHLISPFPSSILIPISANATFLRLIYVSLFNVGVIIPATTPPPSSYPFIDTS